MQGNGIDLYVHEQGFDTTTPTGKAMFQLCGVFAEFERAIIRERVKSGIARAREAGKQWGRPRVSAAIERKVRALRRQNKDFVKVAREAGIGVGRRPAID